MTVCFNIFFIFVTIHCFIHFSITASRDKSMKAKKGAKHKWTPQEEGALIFLDESMKGGEGDHLDRIKSEWRQEFPDSDITDDALQHKLYKLRNLTLEEGERKKNFKWNKELDKELLEVYHNTSPYRDDVLISVEGEWKRRHPNYLALKSTLLNRVRNLLGGTPKYREEDSSHTEFEWKKQYDSDLFHAHNVATSEGKNRLRKTYVIWSELYPQYSHITPNELKRRYDHLKKHPSNQYFPWTEEENEQLYNIFRETMPDKEDQGQRIYDVWTEIHPRYSFMTPYYLQTHASTLAQEKEIRADGRHTRKALTNEQKSDLADIYRQFSGRYHGLFDFHKEWVRKHPRLAFYTMSHLGALARRYVDQGYGYTSERLKEGSSRRRKNKYTPGERQNMLELYNQTLPEKSGHAKRLMKQYNAEHKDRVPIKPKSLKVLVKGWEKGKSTKLPRKEPMIDSSYEPGSSSALRMSEDFDEIS